MTEGEYISEKNGEFIDYFKEESGLDQIASFEELVAKAYMIGYRDGVLSKENE